MKFFDKKLHASTHWSNLPHWTQGDAVQFITFRLADSLPQCKLHEYRNLRKEIFLERNKEKKHHYSQLMIVMIDRWLDQGYGKAQLQNARIRKIVSDALHFWDNERYLLLAYVIMPNHIHILLIPSKDDDMYRTFQSLKRYTSRKINKLLELSGSFWENDMFDRMPRDFNEYNRYIDYIIANPQGLPQSSYTIWQRPYSDF